MSLLRPGVGDAVAQARPLGTWMLEVPDDLIAARWPLIGRLECRNQAKAQVSATGRLATSDVLPLDSAWPAEGLLGVEPGRLSAAHLAPWLS
jgi:hypothetical protein